MFTFIFDYWHFWESNSKYLLSDESTKKLRQFNDIDAAITWLYVNDYKLAARALNKAKGDL
jgi:hypothetical protein